MISSDLRSGEAGLLVTEISPSAPFDGYVSDRQQTEKKKLHNVHKEGDLYFNTGDLLTVDPGGFFYFSDRVGDTFRWERPPFPCCNEVKTTVFTDGKERTCLQRRWPTC